MYFAFNQPDAWLFRRAENNPFPTIAGPKNGRQKFQNRKMR
jgi:hypothetical protein